MKKVTYFDVEYANSKNKSICQIGVVCENYNDGEPYYPEKNIYINTEDGFDDNCIRIHGITASKVKNEKNFPSVWKEIERYFTSSVIIGHNVASSDLNALVRSLIRYNIDIPNIYYICTLDLARKYIPSYLVPNYSLGELCRYFNIDMDTEHDAFDDACACADLFKRLVDEYNIDVDSVVRKYSIDKTKEFTSYVSDPVIRKSISELYGMIQGLSIDNIITIEEKNYLVTWKEDNSIYDSQEDINDILHVLNDILSDGIITLDEMVSLQKVVSLYLDNVATSEVTLATQVLDGVLKGISLDGIISEDECKCLRKWLYDYIYLKDHFPFSEVMEALDKILEDSIVTKEEALYIQKLIDEILDPVEALRKQIYDVSNKHICLSGTFEYGTKSEVEEVIIFNGGIRDENLKKTTNILVVGNSECQSFSNGSYGGKVKKAIEFNEKGANIQIIKESDLTILKK